MKFTASTALRWFGFRRTLIVNGLISGAFLAACALFTPTTPHWLILLTLLAGGFFRSLEFTALNAISYADIDQPRMSRATSFASVSQQMSGAIGVAVAAICVQTIQLGFGDPELQARDLSLSFVMVAIISSLSVFVFAKLKPDAGAAVSGKLAASPKPSQRRRSSYSMLRLGGTRPVIATAGSKPGGSNPENVGALRSLDCFVANAPRNDDFEVGATCPEELDLLSRQPAVIASVSRSNPGEPSVLLDCFVAISPSSDGRLSTRPPVNPEGPAAP